jgi:hypothetical protein
MRLIDADQFDELVDIVDALAQHVEEITNERPGFFAPDESIRIQSIVARARRLYQKRIEKGEQSE